MKVDAKQLNTTQELSDTRVAADTFFSNRSSSSASTSLNAAAGRQIYRQASQHQQPIVTTKSDAMLSAPRYELTLNQLDPSHRLSPEQALDYLRIQHRENSIGTRGQRHQVVVNTRTTMTAAQYRQTYQALGQGGLRSAPQVKQALDAVKDANDLDLVTIEGQQAGLLIKEVGKPVRIAFTHTHSQPLGDFAKSLGQNLDTLVRYNNTLSPSDNPLASLSKRKMKRLMKQAQVSQANPERLRRGLWGNIKKGLSKPIKLLRKNSGGKLPVTSKNLQQLADLKNAKDRAKHAQTTGRLNVTIEPHSAIKRTIKKVPTTSELKAPLAAPSGEGDVKTSPIKPTAGTDERTDETPTAGADETPTAGADETPTAGADETPTAGTDEMPTAGTDEIPTAAKSKDIPSTSLKGAGEKTDEISNSSVASKTLSGSSIAKIPQAPASVHTVGSEHTEYETPSPISQSDLADSAALNIEEELKKSEKNLQDAIESGDQSMIDHSLERHKRLMRLAKAHKSMYKSAVVEGKLEKAISLPRIIDLSKESVEGSISDLGDNNSSTSISESEVIELLSDFNKGIVDALADSSTVASKKSVKSDSEPAFAPKSNPGPNPDLQKQVNELQERVAALETLFREFLAGVNEASVVDPREREESRGSSEVPSGHSLDSLVVSSENSKGSSRINGGQPLTEDNLATLPHMTRAEKLDRLFKSSHLSNTAAKLQDELQAGVTFRSLEDINTDLQTRFKQPDLSYDQFVNMSTLSPSEFIRGVSALTGIGEHDDGFTQAIDDILGIIGRRHNEEIPSVVSSLGDVKSSTASSSNGSPGSSSYDGDISDNGGRSENEDRLEENPPPTPPASIDYDADRSEGSSPRNSAHSSANSSTSSNEDSPIESANSRKPSGKDSTDYSSNSSTNSDNQASAIDSEHSSVSDSPSDSIDITSAPAPSAIEFELPDDAEDTKDTQSIENGAEIISDLVDELNNERVVDAEGVVDHANIDKVSDSTGGTIVPLAANLLTDNEDTGSLSDETHEVLDILEPPRFESYVTEVESEDDYVAPIDKGDDSDLDVTEVEAIESETEDDYILLTDKDDQAINPSASEVTTKVKVATPKEHSLASVPSALKGEPGPGSEPSSSGNSSNDLNSDVGPIDLRSITDSEIDREAFDGEAKYTIGDGNCFTYAVLESLLGHQVSSKQVLDFKRGISELILGDHGKDHPVTTTLEKLGLRGANGPNLNAYLIARDIATDRTWAGQNYKYSPTVFIEGLNKSSEVPVSLTQLEDMAENATSLENFENDLKELLEMSDPIGHLIKCAGINNNSKLIANLTGIAILTKDVTDLAARYSITDPELLNALPKSSIDKAVPTLNLFKYGATDLARLHSNNVHFEGEGPARPKAEIKDATDRKGGLASRFLKSKRKKTDHEPMKERFRRPSAEEVANADRVIRTFTDPDLIAKRMQHKGNLTGKYKVLVDRVSMTVGSDAHLTKKPATTRESSPAASIDSLGSPYMSSIMEIDLASLGGMAPGDEGSETPRLPTSDKIFKEIEAQNKRDSEYNHDISAALARPLAFKKSTR